MSDCNVCLVGSEPEGACEVFTRRIVKCSRKQFVCYECRCVIPIGSRYEYIFSVYEGESEDCHTCMICVDIRDTFYCETDVYSPIMGMLWDDIANSDFFRNLTTGCIAKLKTPAARKYLLERWQKWKGLRA